MKPGALRAESSVVKTEICPCYMNVTGTLSRPTPDTADCLLNRMCVYPINSDRLCVFLPFSVGVISIFICNCPIFTDILYFISLPLDFKLLKGGAHAFYLLKSRSLRQGLMEALGLPDALTKSAVCWCLSSVPTLASAACFPFPHKIAVKKLWPNVDFKTRPRNLTPLIQSLA